MTRKKTHKQNVGAHPVPGLCCKFVYVYVFFLSLRYYRKKAKRQQPLPALPPSLLPSDRCLWSSFTVWSGVRWFPKGWFWRMFPGPPNPERVQKTERQYQLGKKQHKGKKTRKQNVHGIVPGFWGGGTLFMCFSPIRKDPKKTHKQNFGTHSVPGQSRRFVYVYVFFIHSLNQKPERGLQIRKQRYKKPERGAHSPNHPFTKPPFSFLSMCAEGWLHKVRKPLHLGSSWWGWCIPLWMVKGIPKLGP